MKTEMDYRGFKIALQERTDGWQFKIDANSADGEDIHGRSCDSVAAAKAAIDDHHTQLAKAAKVAFPAVDMLTQFGTAVRVRGMHGATGALLMDTSEKRPFVSVCPAVPLVELMLTQRVALEAALRDLTGVL